MESDVIIKRYQNGVHTETEVKPKSGRPRKDISARMVLNPRFGISPSATGKRIRFTNWLMTERKVEG